MGAAGPHAASAQLELQRTLYDSRNPTRRWLHRARRDWIVGHLRALPPGERALEVGPGSCIYLPELAARFGEVWSSDIEEDFLTHARSLQATYPNLRVVEDDLTDTRLPEASFDLVLCTEVIEHIEDGEAALRSLRRLLRPTGALVLSTPQRFSTLELAAKIAFLPGVIELVRAIYKEPILPTGHVSTRTRGTLEAELRAAGLAVEETTTLGFYVPGLAELGGAVGLTVEKALEVRLRGGPLDPLLWTQCYVARPA